MRIAAFFWVLLPIVLWSQDIDLNKLRYYHLSYLNACREQVGRDTLEETTELDWLAQSWAETLSANETYSHELNGKDVREYFEWPHNLWWGENLALMHIREKWDENKYGYEWMLILAKSPKHQENMLNIMYIRVGLGAAAYPDGQILFVEEYADR